MIPHLTLWVINTTEVLKSLTDITQKLFTWFTNNQVKANNDKCHFLLSTQNEANIQIENVTIKSSLVKKLREITVDNKLTFDRHVENICKKNSRKLNPIARLVNYIDVT